MDSTTDQDYHDLEEGTDVDYEPPTESESDPDFFDAESNDDEEDMEDNEAEADEEENENTGHAPSYELEVNFADNGDGTAEANLETVTLVQEDGIRTVINLTRQQMLQVVSQISFGNLLRNSQADAAEETEHFGQNYGTSRYRRRRYAPRNPVRRPPVPSPEGTKLMHSGVFGSCVRRRDGGFKDQKHWARRLLAREHTTDRASILRENAMIRQSMIPSSTADTIIHYNDRCYSGQFSDDGNFFFSCSQDFLVRMYDTSNPYDWKHYKSVEFVDPGWTITDATLSPDNKYLAYTSMRDIVCLATTDPADNSDPRVLSLRVPGQRGMRRGWGGGFSVFSVRFSGDGRELVAGAGDDAVYVYDLETNQTILRIPGHDADVNAVCYGDKSSPHLLYSGSDDTRLKVWDRRSLHDNREAGVFVGHTEGLTYVDSKGDGRYVLSNGKDQCMKLWDLRKMMSSEQAADISPASYMSDFDYRNSAFPNTETHPSDCSVVSFYGHSVLKTLIRCHFSPPGSTDSRYVYSGSQDGKVYVYNLDATLAEVIDVEAATRNSRPRDSSGSEYIFGMDDNASWRTCVRDASWHPYIPMIAATSWNGWGGSSGTCTVHSWHDGASCEDDSGIEMGRRVDAEMRHDPELYSERRTTRIRRRRWVY